MGMGMEMGWEDEEGKIRATQVVYKETGKLRRNESAR